MVSLRRRKLLGLSAGISSFPVELPAPTEDCNAVGHLNLNDKSFEVYHAPPTDLSHENEMTSQGMLPMTTGDERVEKEDQEGSASELNEQLEHLFNAYVDSADGTINVPEDSVGASNTSSSGSPKDESNQYYPGKQIKRRKRHRRKHLEDQEKCIMRGVYFKNMKWQAAIKVDKKQIHLGTVGSQEEAARLYDRAAYMCGRELNFELSEEAKQELSKYKWEEFLVITRNMITDKKRQRRIGTTRQRKPGIPPHSSEVGHERDTGATSLSDHEDVHISVS